MMRQHTTRSAPPQQPAVTARSPVTVQRKLAVSTPGDRYEREADRVADEVMRMPLDEAESVMPSPPAIQRMCAGCEEEEETVQRAVEDEEEEGTLQGKHEGAAPAQTPAGFGAQLTASRNGGAVLPPATRAVLEPRFGRAFDGVRVHDGRSAAALAGSVRARAFTVGRDIFFGAGQYAPGSERGQRLIAHELVHTIQQGGEETAVQRQGEEEPSAPEPEAEGAGIRIYPRIEAPPDASFGRGPEVGGAEEEEATVGRATTDAVLDEPESSAASERPYATGMSAGALRDALGDGQPLDAGARTQMESRYGRPLDGIRVHADPVAKTLASRFNARAFAFGNHLAFGSGAYAPHGEEGGRLLRHEISHAIGGPAPPGRVFRAACTRNCPPGTATTYAPTSAASPNCYGYALGSGARLNPGQVAGTAEFTTMMATITNPAASLAALAAVAPYFNASNVRTNTEADIGTQLSSDCTRCCTDKRKIIEVCGDPITGYAPTGSGSSFLWWPAVSSSVLWDFHWYRKDADRAWSHKRDGNPSQRDDSAGASPICNPCNAGRNHPPFNYTNVIGSWCV